MPYLIVGIGEKSPVLRHSSQISSNALEYTEQTHPAPVHDNYNRMNLLRESWQCRRSIFLFDYRNPGGNNICDLFNKFGDDYAHRFTAEKQDFIA